MYTVYDFINNDIEAKYMRFGWYVKISKTGSLILTYNMLNFDWSSLDFVNDEIWNMFLTSKSFKRFKTKTDKAMSKFKRTYFDAMNISHLKMLVSEYGIKVDVDRLVSKTVKKKSNNMKARLDLKLTSAITPVYE